MCFTFQGHEKKAVLLIWDALTFKMCGILEICMPAGGEAMGGGGRGRHFTCQVIKKDNFRFDLQ